MKKIAFKIAFSASVGSGHLYRCSRLSKKLKEKGVVTYFLIDRKINQKFFFLTKHFKYCVLKRNFKSEIKFLKSKNINSIIIDNPKVTPQKQKKYKTYLKKLFIYQDIPTKNFADIIINHNYIKNSKNIYEKKSKKDCKFFLGPKFYLMENHECSNYKKKLISIFLGGNTPKILLEKIFRILVSLNLKNFKIIVFTGVFNKDFLFLKKRYPQINIKFKTQENYKKFFKIVSVSKFFFTSGGSTIIESIFLKTPAIAFIRSKNQLNNCLNFSKEKLIFFGGKKIDENHIIYFMNNLLENKKIYNKFLNKLNFFKNKNFKNNLTKFILKEIE